MLCCPEGLHESHSPPLWSKLIVSFFAAHCYYEQCYYEQCYDEQGSCEQYDHWKDIVKISFQIILILKTHPIRCHLGIFRCFV